MYYVMGGDNEPHGPVDADTVFQWITQGRANGQTKARNEDYNEWRPLSEFNEFASKVSPSSPADTPQHSEGDATGGLIPYKNKHALIGYYMSVGGLIMMCIPVLGLIYTISVVVIGIKGLKNAKANPHVKGQVHCWVAIIGGSLETLVTLILSVLFAIGFLTEL